MFWHVSLHVKSQVVRSRETSLADFAFERFGARVLSIVASQLIRPENDQFDNGACWERERERERDGTRNCCSILAKECTEFDCIKI